MGHSIGAITTLIRSILSDPAGHFLLQNAKKCSREQQFYDIIALHTLVYFATKTP